MTGIWTGHERRRLQVVTTPDGTLLVRCTVCGAETDESHTGATVADLRAAIRLGDFDQHHCWGSTS